MAYDKTHKKDYYQLNVKLDFIRDADVINYLDLMVDNKREAVCEGIRALRALKKAQEILITQSGIFRIEEVEE